MLQHLRFQALDMFGQLSGGHAGVLLVFRALLRHLGKAFVKSTAAALTATVTRHRIKQVSNRLADPLRRDAMLPVEGLLDTPPFNRSFNRTLHGASDTVRIE